MTQSILPASMNSQDERISPNRPWCDVSDVYKTKNIDGKFTLHSRKVSRTLGKSGRERKAKLTDLIEIKIKFLFFCSFCPSSPGPGGAGYGDPGDEAQGALGTDEQVFQVISSVVLLHAVERVS